MFSLRFNRPVVLTQHAVLRMAERQMDEALLMHLIDNGGTRYSDVSHLWAWLHVPDREDNLLCAVLVLEDVLVVKTVMHRWELVQ